MGCRCKGRGSGSRSKSRGWRLEVWRRPFFLLLLLLLLLLLGSSSFRYSFLRRLHEAFEALGEDHKVLVGVLLCFGRAWHCWSIFCRGRGSAGLCSLLNSTRGFCCCSSSSS